ncbi:MAG: hypothetical protein JEZ07_14705 [Phycisphaerae bacterium]|nr:hypothetical protein [Phycisphaerae bacterium]
MPKILKKICLITFLSIGLFGLFALSGCKGEDKPVEKPAIDKPVTETTTDKEAKTPDAPAQENCGPSG